MKQFNIYEPLTGRQAHNVHVDAIGDAIRPWFWQVEGQAKVENAIRDLTDDAKRDQAMRYLGLFLQPAA